MAVDPVKLKEWLFDAGIVCSESLVLLGSIRFEKPIRAFKSVELADCSIGAYSYFGSGCTIARTNIGRYCSIGGQVRLGMGSHPAHRLTTSPVTYNNIFDERYLAGGKPFADFAVVSIGHDVWIGERSMVMDGITVGTGAIVAAGSVVTRNVDPYTIVAGVPAKPLRARFPPDVVEKLLRSCWWRYDLVELSAAKIIGEWDDPVRCVEEIDAAAIGGRIAPMRAESRLIVRRAEQYELHSELEPLF